MSRPSYIRDGVVLGAAVGLFGVTFGVLAVSAGLTVAQAGAMSLLVFTGASQFAAIAVVASGGSPAAILAPALLLAARNGIYGLALHPHLKGSIVRRLAASHLVIDESTAMAIGQTEPRHREPAFWVAGLSVFVFWNLGTLVGAIGGDALGDPEAWGLDAAFPAGFIVLLRPHIARRAGKVAALTGAVIALVSIPFLPAGGPIIAGALGAVVGLAVARDEGPTTAPGPTRPPATPPPAKPPDDQPAPPGDGPAPPSESP